MHVPRRMMLALVECTIFQHYDLGAPMKYPPHYGAEQNLAAATQCDQNDRYRGLRGRQDDWAGPHRDTKLWKLARHQCPDLVDIRIGQRRVSDIRTTICFRIN
jgi:hypothetical protein